MTNANLVKSIAGYNSAGQKLIDEVLTYQKFVKTEVPVEYWAKFGLDVFWMGEPVEQCRISINGLLVPEQVEQLKTTTYWGKQRGDYYYFCTGKELLDWAKALPEKVKAAIGEIEAMTDEIISFKLIDEFSNI